MDNMAPGKCARMVNRSEWKPNPAPGSAAWMRRKEANRRHLKNGVAFLIVLANTNWGIGFQLLQCHCLRLLPTQCALNYGSG